MIKNKSFQRAVYLSSLFYASIHFISCETDVVTLTNPNPLEINESKTDVHILNNINDAPEIASYVKNLQKQTNIPKASNLGANKTIPDASNVLQIDDTNIAWLEKDDYKRYTLQVEKKGK
ncbi:hypothetical protein [Aquimarina agarivorans]|uniref:hypothetical protein n=1 Tax=Aquimarina agarivorans TaxID=980584 RepID=UPI000248EC25|nr:hypothetical protein [Aquimarina agarivorans]